MNNLTITNPILDNPNKKNKTKTSFTNENASDAEMNIKEQGIKDSKKSRNIHHNGLVRRNISKEDGQTTKISPSVHRDKTYDKITELPNKSEKDIIFSFGHGSMRGTKSRFK